MLAAAPAQAACPKDPTFDPAIPTWEEVNGFELGSRQATYDEVVKYLNAVDVASPQVIPGQLARKSWHGRALPYVVVSVEKELASKRLARTAKTMRAIRNGKLSRKQIARTARTLPGIVNVSSNVHGNEPSGTDASMKLLYELVARTDCANLQRLKRLVTFILPLQNPDGREAGTRENAYGFDMNRDWFARTQPETDSKIDLVRQYPPLFFIDAHEQAGTAYFFPPNADPIHHEISRQALDAINKTYATAMKEAAERDGFDYTNYTTYDLFFMGYGDTVPSTAFGSAGMTFEKGGQSPYNEKTHEQWVTQDATVSAAARDKRRLVTEWGAQWRQAAAQGRRGAREPNLVVQPSNTVQFPVPDTKVFGYWIRADRSAGDAAYLMRRLRALDVRVYRLRKRARVQGAHAYGVPGFKSLRLPAGTFWVPLGQPQKHWIQAVMGEDSYVPFPYFYDVSGWSNPLLMGLEGGFAAEPNTKLPVTEWKGASIGGVSGAYDYGFVTDSVQAFSFLFELLRRGFEVSRVDAELAAHPRGWAGFALKEPTDRARREIDALARRYDVPLFGTSSGVEHGTRVVPIETPKIALLDDAVSVSGSSAGFAAFVLERRLRVPVERLSGVQVESGALLGGGYTAFVVPGGLVPTPLTPAALAQIQLYVRGGGRYVGMGRPGILTANAAGLMVVAEAPPPPDYQVPGASFRVDVDPEQPLGWGFRRESFLFNVGDPIIESSTGQTVASYPADDRFFVSGYTEGADALKGTPAALSQPVADGHAVVFAFDANFRAYTESTMRMFANALLHPLGAAPGGSVARRVRPELMASPVGPPDSVVRVAPGDEQELRAAAAAAELPAGARVTRDLRGVSLRVPNPRGLDEEQLEWPAAVLDALRRARVTPTLIVL